MRTKSETRRLAIVEAAAAVFLEKGYEAASMAEISSRAGGSKATLYSYFPSKEELFLSVMSMQAEARISAGFAHLEQGSSLEASLQAFGEHFLRSILSPELMALRSIVIGEGARSGVGRLFFDHGPRVCWQRLADFLELEMTAGRLRRARSWTAAMHLIALLEAEHQETIIVGHSVIPCDEVLHASIRDAVAVFMAGYRP